MRREWQSIQRIVFVLLCLLAWCVILRADSTSTKNRTVTKLAEGVYEIRHEDAPDQFPQSNTTVVIGEDAVLVVDSCYLPSTARTDIAQIRQWTKKPVRYLLNTHWHYDHTMGNAEYLDAFPGLTVIAQIETRNQIAGYNPQWFQNFPKRTERIQKLLDTGKYADGKPLKPSEIEDYRKVMTGIGPVQEEFSKSGQRLNELIPTVTFDHEMTIELGHREVRLIHAGRGNTAGDAAVYLPEEKILVTGDLLDSPVPYHFGGYPKEQITTLETLDRLDAKTIVPGHGDIQHDKTFLHLEIEFLRAVTEEVRNAVFKEGSGPGKLEAVEKEVMNSLNVESFRTKFAGSNQNDRDFFDETLDELIKAAYAESWGK